MVLKRKKRGATGKRKPTGKKSGELCFKLPERLRSAPPTVKQVIDLRTGGELTEEELKKILADASKYSVGFVVLNAPFKVRAA